MVAIQGEHRLQLPGAWEEDEEKNFKNLPLQEAYQEDKRPLGTII